MRKLILILVTIFGLNANCQNSYLHMKDGEIIAVKDSDAFYTSREGISVHVQKKNGKFASSYRKFDMDKIEKLETANGVTYRPFEKDEKTKGFYKTLIQGKDKKLIICFRPYEESRGLLRNLQVSYSITDLNDNQIESDYFKEKEQEKYKNMLERIKIHFPTCSEVLENIVKAYEVKPRANLFMDEAPQGFMYQNKVFVCQ